MSKQLSLFDKDGKYDDAPLAERPMTRKSGPLTSDEAARVVFPELGKIQRLVMEVFRERGPMTARKAEQLPEFKSYGFSTIRKRISELASEGLLIVKGVDKTGRAPATIYGVAPLLWGTFRD